MPDQQPAENAPVQPNDADTAAAVSAAQDSGMGPGGGGLGSPSAATGASPRGTAPNAPIDVPTPHPGGTDDDTTGSPRTTTDTLAGGAGGDR